MLGNGDLAHCIALASCEFAGIDTPYLPWCLTFCFILFIFYHYICTKLSWHVFGCQDHWETSKKFGVTTLHLSSLSNKKLVSISFLAWVFKRFNKTKNKATKSINIVDANVTFISYWHHLLIMIFLINL